MNLFQCGVKISGDFQVEMHKCYRPGDIIVARVVSLLSNDIKCCQEYLNALCNGNYTMMTVFWVTGTASSL